MEVRQAVAGLRGAHLFDEVDHLGAYLKKNRFDQDMADQLKDGKASMVVWDGMSHDVDRSFEGEDWESSPFPAQEFPQEVLKLLGALDARRASGWLSAESHIRNLGEEDRNDLATMLAKLRKSLNKHPARYFLYGSDTPFFIWLQRSGDKIDWQKVHDKAGAAALLTPTADMTGIMIEATAGGIYKTAYTFEVAKPSSRIDNNAHIYDDAERMKKRAQAHSQPPAAQAQKMPRVGRKPGRNDPCPCQSGLKYKKCHGR
ncbi:SEC-C metal-binding domain-containing protein [Nitratireductor sp. GCM10026969]|uniref:SEC-C metal-binding domain-containing protein n=1 Tax=Nitratireductor sp. GCM10026969 TaxID=3252645 RepID=UPI00361803B0